MTDEERKEHKNQSRKNRYDWLKAHGICTCCGCEDAINNSVLCPECSYKNWLANYNNYHNKTEEEKSKLRERQYERDKIRKAERRAKGLCWRCGNPIEQHGKTKCNKCIEKQKEQNRKQCEKRGIKPKVLLDGINLCIKCGKDRPKHGYKLCEQCYEKILKAVAMTPTGQGKRVDNYFTQTMCLFFNQK